MKLETIDVHEIVGNTEPLDAPISQTHFVKLSVK